MQTMLLRSRGDSEGSNSKVGGKGSIMCLTGSEKDFVEKAQSHIIDFAKRKHERREHLGTGTLAQKGRESTEKKKASRT
jgi:hypothetical protein